jgi:lipoate-protein ligase A
LAEGTKFANSGSKTADCFAHTSDNDVVDPVTGMKVCGCALRLTEYAVLVQASIPNGVPLADPQKLFKHPAVVRASSWRGDDLAAALSHHLAETGWF